MVSLYAAHQYRSAPSVLECERRLTFMSQNSPFDLYTTFAFLNVTWNGINELSVFSRLVYSKKQKGPPTPTGARALAVCNVSDLQVLAIDCHYLS